jgi:hypothetical protein
MAFIEREVATERQRREDQPDIAGCIIPGSENKPVLPENCNRHCIARHS